MEQDVYEAGARRVAEEAAGLDSARCIEGEVAFWLVGDYAVVPGHIYSREGAIEFRRTSGMCEFHFDALFAEEEDLTPRGWQIVEEYREARKDG